MKKALFVFNGEEMCFVHVLLNGLDMKSKGYQVGIVIEGAACALLKEYAAGTGQFGDLFKKCMDQGLIDSTCKACTAKMGATEAAEKLGIPFSADMNGHPSMSAWCDQGYDIITF